jgi:hypothetical protein
VRLCACSRGGAPCRDGPRQGQPHVLVTRSAVAPSPPPTCAPVGCIRARCAGRLYRPAPSPGRTPLLASCTSGCRRRAPGAPWARAAPSPGSCRALLRGCEAARLHLEPGASGAWSRASRCSLLQGAAAAGLYKERRLQAARLHLEPPSPRSLVLHTHAHARLPRRAARLHGGVRSARRRRRAPLPVCHPSHLQHGSREFAEHRLSCQQHPPPESSQPAYPRTCQASIQAARVAHVAPLFTLEGGARSRPMEIKTLRRGAHVAPRGRSTEPAPPRASLVQRGRAPRHASVRPPSPPPPRSRGAAAAIVYTRMRFRRGAALHPSEGVTTQSRRRRHRGPGAVHVQPRMRRRRRRPSPPPEPPVVILTAA